MNTLETINNKIYDVESFHPIAFEADIYAVRFHEHGKKWLDMFSKNTLVHAKNELHAIELAKKEIKI